MRGPVQQATLLGLMMLTMGCLMPRAESPPTHTYHLSLEKEIPESETRQADAPTPILLVSLPQSDPGFDTQRMVFLKRRYELEYYSVNQWADTPARMLAPLLVETLSRRGGWRDVMLMPASIRGDYRLDTSSLVLQQEFLQQPSRVRLAARMQLINLKESRILGTRTLEVVEDTPSDDAYGGVLAANRAVAKWLDHVRTWAGSCLLNERDCTP